MIVRNNNSGLNPSSLLLLLKYPIICHESALVIMAPSVTLDFSSDFSSPQSALFAPPSRQRTLLLSPPSLSSHPEKLNAVHASHDRSVTDIQMLDRLSLSLVSLSDSTYDVILVLLDADTRHSESQQLLTRHVLLKITQALKPGGRLQFQDRDLASKDSDLRREAIFAGLMVDSNGLVKPNQDTTQAVPLRFGKNKAGNGIGSATALPSTDAVPLPLNGKRKNGATEPIRPAGVGYIDFSDDLDAPADENFADDDDDDDLIDENTLLDDDDLSRPIIQRTPALSPFLSFSPPLLTCSTLFSSLMPPSNRQAPTRMQRLYMWSRPTTRSRRCS